MELTKRDLTVISVMALGTAIAVYFAAGQAIGGIFIGLLIGAVGGIIPCILFRIFQKK